MEGYTRAGQDDEFKDRKPHDVLVNGVHVVIVRVGGEVIAFENSCPHQHFSLLHNGSIDGSTITCPMHGWTFDMRSGSSTNGNGKLKKLNVKFVGGWIWVENVNSNQSFSLFD